MIDAQESMRKAEEYLHEVKSKVGARASWEQVPSLVFVRAIALRDLNYINVPHRETVFGVASTCSSRHEMRECHTVQKSRAPIFHATEVLGDTSACRLKMPCQF